MKKIISGIGFFLSALVIGNGIFLIVKYLA